jgi:hypothetical protein
MRRVNVEAGSDPLTESANALSEFEILQLAP